MQPALCFGKLIKRQVIINKLQIQTGAHKSTVNLFTNTYNLLHVSVTHCDHLQGDTYEGYN